MATVVITSEYFGRFSSAGLEALRGAGHTVIPNPHGCKLTVEQIIPLIGPADAAVCDLEPISACVMAAAPNLKLVARRGVGLDSVDLREAARRGIKVLGTPGSVAEPVADLVLCYMLALSRQLLPSALEMGQGLWNKRLGAGLTGKTLGLVGMGRIAAAVAKRAAVFGLNIIYFDITPSPMAEQAVGARLVGFDELLATSDFVSLHVPLTPETRGMFGAERLACMKPGAYLINTARGPIVSEYALAAALKSGALAGAAVDVFDVEPKTNSPLVGMENVIMTPHVGTFTRECFIRMDVEAAENVCRFFMEGGSERA